MIRRTFLKGFAGFVARSAIPRPSASRGSSLASAVPESTSSRYNDFLSLARELAQEHRTVIGVFSDPTFDGRHVPSNLRAEHFQRIWGARKDVRIELLDKYQVRSYSILFKGRMDVLVYPYGSLYPMDAFPYFSGDTLLSFMKRGGAVLTTGGIPFGSPVSDEGKLPIEGKPDPLSLNNQIYERWVAPLGYKYYIHPYEPPITRVDRQFLSSLPSTLKMAGCQTGIVANNSSHEPVPNPYHGNIFPERYPARQVTPLVWGSDQYGRLLTTTGLLIQDFEDGSRRIHFGHEKEPHPLSPQAPHFQGIMRDLLSLLVNRLIVREVGTGYACYRQGESVQVRATLVNFAGTDAEAEVILEIRAGDSIVDNHTETLRFPPRETVTKEWHWTPSSFESDEYQVSLSIRRNAQTLSRAQNGFVIWKEDVVRKGPTIEAHGRYLHTGTESFLSGTNYYESTRGEIMWYRPDVSRIAADLRSMRECGVNYIRPHYHHLKWFKDYLVFQYGKLLPFFADLESVAEPMPDERAWRILDAFIYLCQNFGIVYGGDLFTLVPEEMGDPRGWFPFNESVFCYEKRTAEQAFLKQISLRYKDVPGISWDLWNEPEVPLDALSDWTKQLRDTLEQSGAPRLITVGGASGENLEAAIDYLGIHSDLANIRKTIHKEKRPALMQEIYMDHPEDLTSELAQAEDMREGILATVKNGYCGVAPWSWTRQMRLWQDSYQHDSTFRMESWDDRLGTHVHDDGTLKPAGQVFQDLSLLLRTIAFRNFDSLTHRIHTDRGELVVKLKGMDGVESYSLHHISGGSCYAAMSLTAAAWNGRPILSGPAGGYVLAFADSDKDLFQAERIFVKSEVPGTVRVAVRSSAPRRVTLTNVSPLGNRPLDTLRWFRRGNEIELTIAPTQQAYWIAVEW